MTAYLLRMRSGCEGGGKGPLVQTEKSGTLATNNDQTLFIMGTKIYENHPSDSRITESQDGICQTLTSKMGTGGGNVPLVLMDQGGSQMSIETDKVGTLRAQEHGHQPIVFGKVSRPRGKDGLGERWDEVNVASTRNCMDIGDARTQEVVCIAENIIGRKVENGGNGLGAQEDISYTLNATGVHGVANEGQVRRLTPIECERLQGFPDNYTRIPYRGKPAEQCPDSPRYKAIGNSWAVPCVRWIGRRINKELDKE